ncbi:PQQ-binding-like beta-propeller repeat protein [Haloarchaeobius sp. HRN-SO-5]|uniref:outer membrane protein assembly factor BamB family protein n=1 Tax=Haloarchaeobius sp. HRN-SO-5 TaxID=3446118 RepID=UPI003EBF9C70
MPSSSRRELLGFVSAGVGITAAGCLTLEQPTADGSWPRRTLTNGHTGYATTDGPKTDLHTVWHRKRPDSFAAIPSPVLDDGTLYLGYSQDSRGDERGGAWVESFDAATGDSRWTTELFRTDESYYFYHSDSMVVHEDRLFLQTRPGLTMLTTEGDVQWAFDNLYGDQQAPDVVTPVVTDDLVVTGTYDSQVEDDQDEVVYGVDAVTGEERWDVAVPEWQTMWQLTGADDVVYVPFLGEGLVALDMATGTERWRWEAPIDGTPTVVDDLLLVPLEHGNQEKTLVALDRSDRSLRWQVPIGHRWAEAGLSVAHGRVYLATYFGLEARRLETGERVWRFGLDIDEQWQSKRGEPRFFLDNTPVVSGDAVYTPGVIERDRSYGYLFVVDAATGEELSRVEMGRNEHARTATPAVTSDLVFLASNHGDLYAFGECSVMVAGHCLSG